MKAIKNFLKKPNLMNLYDCYKICDSVLEKIVVEMETNNIPVIKKQPSKNKAENFHIYVPGVFAEVDFLKYSTDSEIDETFIQDILEIANDNNWKIQSTKNSMFPDISDSERNCAEYVDNSGKPIITMFMKHNDTKTKFYFIFFIDENMIDDESINS